MSDISRVWHLFLIGVIILCLLITNLYVTTPNESLEGIIEASEEITDGEPFNPQGIKHTRANEPFEGYTLFSPVSDTNTYLIDNSGTLVHTWPSSYIPKYSVYLLEDGSVLRMGDLSFPPSSGKTGGCVQKISHDGTVLWYFEHNSDSYSIHHDLEILPNGNVLIILKEHKTISEAVEAGRNPDLVDDDGLWSEAIIEVEPSGPTGGNIVWEWHFWDHMIQDFNNTKDNHGIVEEHPERFDINWIRNPANVIADWIHLNAVDYNKELDQILITARHTDEIYVIDHSTTTEEAADHTGGASGKGGDFLYRWGNPRVYRAGNESNRKLFNPHDGQWIEPNHPGEGNILVFNNGWQRPGPDYSTIEEVVPPVDENGNYTIVPGSAYGPQTATWTYQANNSTELYSQFMGGCQRLPNGNTLICNATGGFFLEVTPDNFTVWEYNNPYPSANVDVFKIHRYASNYPGLANIKLNAKLTEGWNLISIPLIQPDNNLTHVLNPIDGLYDALQWFDSTDPVDPWKHHKVGKPIGNDLFELNESMGFWIRITDPGETIFIYDGEQPTSNQFIPLHPGWNMVGYPSLSNRNRTAALNNLIYGLEVDSIWTFDAATQTWEEIKAGDNFVVGRGYWIHAAQECVWEVPV